MYLNCGTQNEFVLIASSQVTSVVQQPDILCILFVSGESKEQAKPSRVSQLSQQERHVHESSKEIQFQPSLITDKCEYCCVFLEVLPTSEGDMLRLSKDSVLVREIAGSSTGLPQKLLPLCSLQHKTQVSLGLLHVS